MRGLSRFLAWTVGLVCLVFSLSGCISEWFSGSASYDSRPLTVQTLDFFNQRQPGRLKDKNWKGDWIFRRDRLELIDQALRNTKPDILLVQEALERIGSTAEVDRNILSAGSLSDYDWQQQTVAEYADTQERELMAVATAVPLKLRPRPEAAKAVWPMGKDGYLQAASLSYEGQDILVLNVQMPAQSSTGPTIWYDFILGHARDLLHAGGLCARRLIIGGYLPADEGNPRYAELLRILHLKDVSAGSCDVAGHCYTATPINDIFMAVVGEETPTRTDKILVHQATNIYSSGRDVEEYDNTNHYAHEFGLSRLWPSIRFGWKTQVRLARCRDDEFGVTP